MMKLLYAVAALACTHSCLAEQGSAAAQRIPKLDFKGIYFGEEMRTASGKLPDFFHVNQIAAIISLNGSVGISNMVVGSTSVANTPMELSLHFVPTSKEEAERVVKLGKYKEFKDLDSYDRAVLGKCLFYQAAGRFARRDFSRVRSALVQKFGEPSKEELIEVKNGMGVSLESTECTWLMEGAIIILKERYGKVDRSLYSFTCTTLMPEDTSKMDAKDL